MTTAADSSGNGNDGTYQGIYGPGDPLLVTDPQCTLRLAGAGYVDASAVVPGVAGAAPITYGLWVRPTAAGSLLSFNTNQNPPNDNRTATYWSGGFFGVNTPTPGDVPQTTNTAAVYPAGSTYLVAFEVQEGSQLVYVNGALAATGVRTGTKLPVQATDIFGIGVEWDGPATPSELGFGDYGEAFVFAGALTAPQHAALYAAGATSGDFFTDLLALGPDGYWRLNEICGGWIIGDVQLGAPVASGWQ